MKSRAQIKSHPLHPMLVAFPIAFLVGCLIADALGRMLDRSSIWTAGAYMSIAAVVSGLIAGIPGFIDYISVVPPASTAKKRATWHMAINVSALALVALGWGFRDGDSLRPGWFGIMLELAAVALVTAGGWLGATLVYRNQIGVDHRYADAGRWREVSVEGTPGQVVAIDGAQEMKPGQMWLVHWKRTPPATEMSADSASHPARQRLVLARTDEGFAAFDDHCTHRGGSLADGVLICGTVQCPWHGSHFDVGSGEVRSGPATKRIGTYRAELDESTVRLTLPLDTDAKG